MKNEDKKDVDSEHDSDGGISDGGSSRRNSL